MTNSWAHLVAFTDASVSISKDDVVIVHCSIVLVTAATQYVEKSRTTVALQQNTNTVSSGSIGSFFFVRAALIYQPNAILAGSYTYTVHNSKYVQSVHYKHKLVFFAPLLLRQGWRSNVGQRLQAGTEDAPALDRHAPLRFETSS